LNYEANLLKL